MSKHTTGKARIIAKERPKTNDSGVTCSQVGRDYLLEVDGKIVPGIISKRIDFTPNDLATLTIIMKLPEIVYLDDSDE